ncbi:MAG: hypothetical protein ACRDRK_12530 [Pseudonocardia sp.]
MAVPPPTAAEARKAREQAARSAAERARVARTPLLAVLGAGDFAVTTVVNAVTTVRARAAERADATSQRVSGFPRKLTPDELRKAADDLRSQAGQTYVDLTERGEKAWGRIRKQPQVKRALSTIEGYTEKLDARIDDLVDDARDAAEQTLSTLTRQTRSTGEKFARVTRKAANRTAPESAARSAGRRPTGSRTDKSDTTSSDS